MWMCQFLGGNCGLIVRVSDSKVTGSILNTVRKRLRCPWARHLSPNHSMGTTVNGCPLLGVCVHGLHCVYGLPYLSFTSLYFTSQGDLEVPICSCRVFKEKSVQTDGGQSRTSGYWCHGWEYPDPSGQRYKHGKEHRYTVKPKCIQTPSTFLTLSQFIRYSLYFIDFGHHSVRLSHKWIRLNSCQLLHLSTQ